MAAELFDAHVHGWGFLSRVRRVQRIYVLLERCLCTTKIDDAKWAFGPCRVGRWCPGLLALYLLAQRAVTWTNLHTSYQN